MNGDFAYIHGCSIGTLIDWMDDEKNRIEFFKGRKSARTWTNLRNEETRLTANRLSKKYPKFGQKFGQISASDSVSFSLPQAI